MSEWMKETKLIYRAMRSTTDLTLDSEAFGTNFANSSRMKSSETPGLERSATSNARSSSFSGPLDSAPPRYRFDS